MIKKNLKKGNTLTIVLCVLIVTSILLMSVILAIGVSSKRSVIESNKTYILCELESKSYEIIESYIGGNDTLKKDTTDLIDEDYIVKYYDEGINTLSFVIKKNSSRVSFKIKVLYTLNGEIYTNYQILGKGEVVWE